MTSLSTFATRGVFTIFMCGVSSPSFSFLVWSWALSLEQGVGILASIGVGCVTKSGIVLTVLMKHHAVPTLILRKLTLWSACFRLVKVFSANPAIA